MQTAIFIGVSLATATRLVRHEPIYGLRVSESVAVESTARIS